MWNRSAKAKECGWGRSKGLKSCGPVNNMIGATRTGIFCACHVSLFGESALESIKHMLSSMSRAKLLDKVNLHGTTMHGNRGFNGDECFEFCDDHDVDSVNACKRAPPLPFVFGNTKNKTKTMQKKISECGPKTVYGARRQLSKNSRESHLILCCTGAGRCVMLTSTKPGMDGSQWNIVPRSTRAMKIFAKG